MIAIRVLPLSQNERRPDVEAFKYTYDQLYNPLLQALRKLGGSGTIAEIEAEVAESLDLSEKQIDDVHKGNRTKLSYRLAWARFYLRKYGLVENISRGVWNLSSAGYETDSVDRMEVNRVVKGNQSKTTAPTQFDDDQNIDIEAGQDNPSEEFEWQDDLLRTIGEMHPTAFERLCQHGLRLSGFTSVKVTGRSGDGGIDGTGVCLLGRLLAFHVVF